MFIFIDREASEIISLVASVRLSVCQAFYTMRMPRSGRYMGSACRVLSAVFVSNQETFAIKSCAQRSGAFNCFKGCGLFSAKLADVSLLNGNPISRVIDTYSCI